VKRNAHAYSFDPIVTPLVLMKKYIPTANTGKITCNSVGVTAACCIWLQETEQ
jgi:hypothetical protein